MRHISGVLVLLVIVAFISLAIYLQLSSTSEICTSSVTGVSMSYPNAVLKAMASDCATKGQLKETHICNENSGTWWIDLKVSASECNPACVIDVTTGAAEVNWRCTGLIEP